MNDKSTSARERASLWDRKRSGWYRDAARSEIIAGPVIFLMYGFPLSAAVLVGVGIENITSPLSALAFAGAVLCVATFPGLRTGREWARLLGGCVATALFAGGVIVIVQSFPLTELAFQPLWRFTVTLLWASTAFALLGPGARDRFKRARDGTAGEEQGLR
jgi:hypothetical protein